MLTKWFGWGLCSVFFTGLLKCEMSIEWVQSWVEWRKGNRLALGGTHICRMVERRWRKTDWKRFRCCLLISVELSAATSRCAQTKYQGQQLKQNDFFLLQWKLLFMWEEKLKLEVENSEWMKVNTKNHRSGSFITHSVCAFNVGQKHKKDHEIFSQVLRYSALWWRDVIKQKWKYFCH